MPINASTNPRRNLLGTLSLISHGEIAVTQIGVVVTRTTELITLVNSKDIIQLAKCRANKKPEIMISLIDLLFRSFISLWAFLIVKGNKIMLAIINRYEAITIEGIVSWAKRMKIAAVDTERIATGKMISASFSSFMFTFCVSFVGITLLEIHNHIKFRYFRNGNTTLFSLPELKYDYNALEPYMNAQTVEIHHDKYRAVYTEKFNATFEKHSNFSYSDIASNLIIPCKNTRICSQSDSE